MLAARTLRDECGGVAPAVDSPCEAAPVNAVEIAPDLALPPDFAPVLLQAAPAAADARPGVALALSLALHVCVAAGVVGLAAHKFSSGPDDIEMIELVVEQASAAPDSKAETSAPQRPAPRHIAEPAVAPAPASAQERLDELATLPLPPPAPDAAEAIAQDTLRAQAEQRRAAQARAAETARRRAAHAPEIERREEAAREKAERARLEAQRERRAEDTQARAERAQARAERTQARAERTRARADESRRRADAAARAERHASLAAERPAADAAPTAAARSRAGDDGRFDAASYRALVARAVRAAVGSRCAQAAGARMVIALTIGGSGAISSAGVASSSGNSAFDAASAAAVRRAGPFPPPTGRSAVSVPVAVSCR